MTEFSEYRFEHEIDLEPGKAAVLVVDMLKDFLEPDGAMPLPEGQRLYGPINRLLDAIRDGGGHVIWVCDEHPEGDAEFDKRSPHCIKGSRGAEVVDELDMRSDEYRVAKRRYSGFFETDLDLRLRELGIRHVIIVGVVTNICVRSTTHDAFFRGYDVVIPQECVAATSEREQASSLYDIDTHYGSVTDLDTVVGQITSRAAAS